MSYLRGFLQSLNANAGAIQTLFAGCVAIATVAYAILTKHMWSEMRLTNERLYRPNVVAVLEPWLHGSSLFELVVRNAGAVAVHDVKVDIKPDDMPCMTERLLGELCVFGAPIPILT